MKIEDRGYVLTDVPGYERIVIEPDQRQPGGATALFFDREGEVIRFNLADLNQFYRAVEQAVRLADVVANNVREAQRPDEFQ